jgi:hypothetical protein
VRRGILTFAGLCPFENKVAMAAFPEHPHNAKKGLAFHNMSVVHLFALVHSSY